MNCQWEGHFPYLKYVQELCAIYASLLPESDAGRRLLRPETVELLTTTARRGVAADESLQQLWGMMTFFVWVSTSTQSGILYSMFFLKTALVHVFFVFTITLRIVAYMGGGGVDRWDQQI